MAIDLQTVAAFREAGEYWRWRHSLPWPRRIWEYRKELAPMQALGRIANGVTLGCIWVLGTQRLRRLPGVLAAERLVSRTAGRVSRAVAVWQGYGHMFDAAATCPDDAQRFFAW